MNAKQVLIALAIFGPIAAALGAYLGLVSDGTLKLPEWDEISRMLHIGTATLATTLLVLCVGVMVMLALLAPVIYALRARDPFAVLISLVMTGASIAILILSRTVMDQISALILFLANITLSAAVYVAHRIAPKA